MSTTRLTFACFITAAVLLGIFFCSLASAETITITGTVLTPDGQPAAGARVIGQWPFYNPQWRLHVAGVKFVQQETTAAEDGTFTVTIEADGEPWEHGTAAAVKRGFGLGWCRVPLDRRERSQITLNTEATLSGTVTNSDGRPISQAKVGLIYIGAPTGDGWLSRKAFSGTTTDAHGRFRLEGLLPECDLTLAVSADGYATLWQGCEVRRENGDVDIQLPAEAVVTGVVMRDGEPVAGVQVGWMETVQSQMAHQVWGGPRGGDSQGVTVTDAEGRYRLEGMGKRVYDIMLMPPVGWTAVAHKGVKCNPAETLENFDFELIRGGLVSGTVTDAQTREPIANVPILAEGPAYPGSSFAVQIATTNEHGVYQLRLPPGKNRLRLSTRHLFDSRGYSRSNVEPEEHPVEVAAGETISGIDFQISAPLPLTVVVVDSEGEAIPDATIETRHDFPVTRTDQGAARFEIPRLRWGLPAWIIARSEDRRLAGCAVLNGAQETVRVVLQPEAAITGRVVNTEGKGVPDLRIRCSYDEAPAPPPVGEGGADTVRGLTVTNEEGRFELNMLPAGMQIRLYIDGGECAYVSEKDWPTRVSLRPGERRDIGTAVVDMAGRTMRGRVMDAERELLSGCLVLELPSGTTAHTGELGSFELTGLPYYKGIPGHYPKESALLAMHPELPLFAADPGIDPDWGFEPNLIVEPLGSVKGRLVGADGHPIAAREIRLRAAGTIAVLMYDYREFYRRGVRLRNVTFTDAEGAWQFDGLVSNLKYTLQALQPDGYTVLFDEKITPEPGETIDLGEIAAREPE